MREIQGTQHSLDYLVLWYTSLPCIVRGPVTNPGLGRTEGKRKPIAAPTRLDLLSSLSPLTLFSFLLLVYDGMASHTQLSPSSTSPTKLCSKTYKKASQLYLTRRLPESLATLQPIIATSQPQDSHYTNGDHSTVAPIATAAGTWRIKVWNLYITLLSAIVDLGAEEGKNQFGQKEWKAIATQVREGGIWETVVQTGYQGREGSVDAEVVYNL